MVTSLKYNKFRTTYGNILDLLNEKVDFGALTTLAQFYNVSLRCFTFPDFQLSPTLEEIERLLNQLIKDFNSFPKLEEGFTLSELSLVLGINANKLVANWGPKGTIKGLTKKFLEDHAWKMVKEENPELCSATLALLIHGIVLFSNIDNFVDCLVVEVFLTNNPVSFLLAYFYHTFHTRHEKRGGTFLCCAPLLHFWMSLNEEPFPIAIYHGPKDLLLSPPIQSYGTRDSEKTRTSFLDVEGSQMSP